MIRLASPTILAFIVLAALACSSGEEASTDAQPSPSASAAVGRTPPTTSSKPASPTPVETPPVEPAETAGHFRDPTEDDIAAARRIGEALPSLPSTNRYEIVYYPGAVVFEIRIKPDLRLPQDEGAYADIVEEALRWFRSQGHEPCEPPLAAVIAIANTAKLEGTPPPGWQVWEPCKEPNEYQAMLVEQIYESLPRPLPKNAAWEIRWTGDPAVGLFQIWAIDPATNSDFQEAMGAAQDWFREHGHEPCRYPLAGLIGYTSNGAYPPEPTDTPWEPCR